MHALIGNGDQESLQRIIRFESETDVLDFKGPVAWDGADQAASLTKDILAFANTRGGGVLAIGVAEPKPGQFDRVGLTPPQASSFEATRVAQWVNARCEPSVFLKVFHVSVDGRAYVIIDVREFDDVPVMCTKDYFSESGPPPIIQKGRLYVRGPNAESRPLSDPGDVRRLVGAATAKKGAELVAQVRAIVTGTAPETKTGESKTARIVANEMAGFLDRKVGTVDSRGIWLIQLLPLVGVPVFDDAAGARDLLRRCRAQWYGHVFPRETEQIYAQEWGVGMVDGDDAFAFASSAAFEGRTVRFSEMESAEGRSTRGLSRKAAFQAGKYIVYTEAIFGCAARFAFAANLAAHFPGDTPVRIEFGAYQLEGRTLISTDPTVDVNPTGPAQVPHFRWSREDLVAATFATGWMDYCAEALHRFMALLNAEGIKRETLRKWVDRFDTGQ